jgi:hypothetical protein
MLLVGRHPLQASPEVGDRRRDVRLANGADGNQTKFHGSRGSAEQAPFAAPPFRVFDKLRLT